MSIVDKTQHNTRDELAKTRKTILAERGRENMSAGGGDKKSPLSIVDKPDIEQHNTRDELAKVLGWSTGKVAMADKVWKEAEPESQRSSGKVDF